MPEKIEYVLRWSVTHETGDEVCELTVRKIQRKDLPETNRHCVDDETPNDYEPCPKAPIWKFFLIDCGRGDHLDNGSGTLAFLAQFSIDDEHHGRGESEERRMKNLRQGIDHEVVDGMIIARKKTYIPSFRVDDNPLRTPLRTGLYVQSV